MTIISRIAIMIGVGILGVAGTLAVQAAKTPTDMTASTVRGKLTALGTTDSASVSCDRIAVNAEVWSNLDGKSGSSILPNAFPFPKENLASTKAKGPTLKNGCTYTLTVNYSPSRQLPASSEYRISAELPQIRAGETLGYTAKVSPPFAEQVDMKF